MCHLAGRISAGSVEEYNFRLRRSQLITSSGHNVERTAGQYVKLQAGTPELSLSLVARGIFNSFLSMQRHRVNVKI